MSDRVLFYANLVEGAMMLAGIILAFIYGRRWGSDVDRPPLPAWAGTNLDFCLFAWIVLCGAILGSFAAGLLLRFGVYARPEQLVAASAGSQLGMLAGIALYNLGIGRERLPTMRFDRGAFASGAATFLISIPLLFVVAFPWEALLRHFHISLDKQEMINILANASPQLKAALIILATLVAPFGEELFFRAGFFRFARTRLPRWAALLFPAVLFGVLHLNIASFAPLVALGILFSLAYERTRRIETTIIAHGLFNLCSTAIVLLGGDSP